MKNLYHHDLIPDKDINISPGQYKTEEKITLNSDKKKNCGHSGFIG